MRPGWRGWLDAWRGLEHNPVARHLMRAEQRRRRRASWLRRNMLVLIGLAGGIVLHSYYFSIATMPSRAGADEWVLYAVAGLLIAAGPALLLWLAQGVYVAVYDAMGLLGIQGRRQCYLNIDDLASIGLLDDREIVVGALRVLAPPLMWRVVVCAAALIPLKLLIILTMGSFSGGRQTVRSLEAALGALSEIGQGGVTFVEGLQGCWELAPGWLRGLLIGIADTPAVLLFGALACLLLTLLMIGLGRGVRIGAAGAAAGSLTALAQLGFIWPGTMLHFSATMMLPGAHRMLQTTQTGDAVHVVFDALLVASQLIAAGAFLALIAVTASLARSGSRTRALLASALPIIGMGAGLAAMSAPTGLSLYRGASYYSSYYYGLLSIADVALVLLSQYDLGWASLAVCNLPVSVVPLYYLVDVGALESPHWTEWLRAPVLLLIQLALLALLSGFARESVRRRRHESHS